MNPLRIARRPARSLLSILVLGPGLVWSPSLIGRPADSAAQSAKRNPGGDVAAQSKEQPDLSALMSQAGDALQRKDYQAALDPLKTVVRAAPDTAAAWYYLGYAYHGLRQDAEARQAYEKAVELKPDLYQAQVNLGLLLVAMNDPAGAAPHLQKAVSLKPSEARLHLELAMALRASGQGSQAEPELRQALQLDPKMDAAAYELGQVELDQKRYADAAADFTKALAISPGRADAELGLASAAEGMGQTADAELHLEQCLKLEPADLSVRYHLARLYLSEKKVQPALAHLQQLDQANPALPGLAAALGDAYALAGKFSDSEVYYRKALAAALPGGSEVAELHRALGETLLKEGKTVTAEDEFRQALRLDPANLEAEKGLASGLYLEKRYAEAAPMIERLLQAPSANPGLYFLLATCYDHLQDRKRALQAYQQFLAKSGGSNPDQEWQAKQRAKLLSRELGKGL